MSFPPARYIAGQGVSAGEKGRSDVKRGLLLVVFAMLCVGVVSCGGQPDEEITGADWRTWKGYVYGTLEHDGTVDVLLDVAADGMDLCYDKEVREVYSRVDFPYLTASVTDTECSIVLDDLNGDGYTDLRIMLYANGQKEDVTFCWNPADHVFLTVPEVPIVG